VPTTVISALLARDLQKNHTSSCYF